LGRDPQHGANGISPLNLGGVGRVEQKGFAGVSMGAIVVGGGGGTSSCRSSLDCLLPFSCWEG